MAMQHGKRSTYNKGCRCDECKDAEYSYQEKRRQTRLAGGSAGQTGSVVALPTPAPAPDVVEHGPVESAVQREIADLSLAESRPGLAQMALELARLMDNPRATNQKPAAAAKLAELLDRLHKGADAKRSRLAQVRQMTGVRTG